ncbi:hypothetical protein [Duganella sp. BuS-21]|uniref:hypothetical protein n=1 Tax=Duganella sp. BuS-21 TaxID=2943848 RepID=UPI0035A72869
MLFCKAQPAQRGLAQHFRIVDLQAAAHFHLGRQIAVAQAPARAPGAVGEQQAVVFRQRGRRLRCAVRGDRLFTDLQRACRAAARDGAT